MKKTEAVNVALKGRYIWFPGRAAPSEVRDMATAQGWNRVVLGPKPMVVAEGG